MEPSDPIAVCRRARMFPTLTDEEIVGAYRFGELVSFAGSGPLVTAGATAPGLFLLRRTSLIGTGEGGPLPIGPAASADIARLSSFVPRNGLPHRVLDPATDQDATALLLRYAPGAAELPLAVRPDGTVLGNPTDGALARAPGMVGTGRAGWTQELAVVGAGPAGLAAAIAGLEGCEGRGVRYWASPVEARLVAGAEVILVGGGNSAGQAGVFLAGPAARVRLMVRAGGLAASMSHHLIDRIAALRNVEMMTGTRITALDGAEAGLERVRWEGPEGGASAPIPHVFLFNGADPASEWLG